MEKQEQKFDMDQYINDILLALKQRIEGGDDPSGKYDYLMDPPNIKTSSILTEGQLDSVAECNFLGDTFNSLLPLKQFSNGLASWTPSKSGKGREQLTATMISQETHLIPTVLNQPSEKSKKSKKEE